MGDHAGDQFAEKLRQEVAHFRATTLATGSRELPGGNARKLHDGGIAKW